ncbi:MAG: M1 family aminopeptidase [Candidatus Electryonea clarkiae]|nr:M1 family aminopeptidase [Candidatus Electryonea clarkiae]MDP8289313.1 M1 family aminopeptidase [Candidatus Electryonea clarkiae]
MLRYSYSVSILIALSLIFVSAPLNSIACPMSMIDNNDLFDYSAFSELDTIADLNFEVDAYTFHLAFDFDNSTYSGYAEVELSNPEQRAPNPIEFDASSNLLEISEIRSSEGEEFEFDHENDLLSIEIPFDFWEELTIRIEYSGEEGTVNGPFGGMGLWMTDDRAWTFSFPDGAHAWAPVIDSPDCKANVTWELGVPEGLTAVANGTLENIWQEEDLDWFRWIENHPVCTSEMGFAIADYAIIEAQTEPFPIRFYVYRADSADAAFDFARVPQAVEVFEEAFGYEYPFDELKIVECGVFNGWGGQEHQTMISLGHNMITGNRQYESIVVHEIAHQWFADLTTPVHWEHFWLNEGFAVWSEAVWANYLGDWGDYLDEIRSDRNSYFNWEAQGHNQALVNDDYDETMSSPLPYQRGALAIHQLRMRYGEEDFTTAVGNYLDNNEFGHVCSEDLREEFRQVTGDNNIDEWFEQWVWRGEAPLIYWVGHRADDFPEIHIRQIMDNSSSPSHGQLFDVMNVTFGVANTYITEEWPAGEDYFVIRDYEFEGGDLFPNLDVPARFVHRDDLDAPDLTVKFRLAEEDDTPDNVLQPDENAVLQFYIKNDGLPVTGYVWEITPDENGSTDWGRHYDEMSLIEFLQPERVTIEVPVTGDGNGSPEWEAFELNIQSQDFDETYFFNLATGRPEIVLIQDGVSGPVDTLGAILESLDVVWGTPNEDLNNLPENMYESDAVWIEADGRNSEYLFSGDDDVLLDWFSFDGNGVISGQYLDQIWSDANPSWGQAVPGEWTAPINDRAFIGIEDDPIADGRNVVATGQQGVTLCSACCGNPAVFLTQGNEGVAARLDYGWRIAAFGFSLSELYSGPPATMSREELIERTAEYILFRDLTSVSDESVTELPKIFSIDAYPNPFNPDLNITVTLPEASNLRLDIFNILGKHVTTLTDQPVSPGQVRFIWNASNSASGIYLIRSNMGSKITTKKVTLVK